MRIALGYSLYRKIDAQVVDPPAPQLHGVVEDQDAALVAVALHGPGDHAVHRLSVGPAEPPRSARSALLSRKTVISRSWIDGIAPRNHPSPASTRAGWMTCSTSAVRVEPAGEPAYSRSAPSHLPASSRQTSSCIDLVGADGSVRGRQVPRRSSMPALQSARSARRSAAGSHPDQVGRAAEHLHLARGRSAGDRTEIAPERGSRTGVPRPAGYGN